MNLTVPGSWRFMPGEHLGDAHEHRDVIVVSAGVHDADFLAVVRRSRLRRERQVHLLGDRQRVHVRAQSATTGPGLPPRSTPTTPVCATPVRTSMPSARR